MRKVIGGFLAIILLLAGMLWVTKAYFFSIGYTQPLAVNDQGVSFTAKVDGKDYYILDADGRWKKSFLAGVDIGLGAPGSFPGEFAIGYDMYFDWFTQIGELGSNVIRVYTPQSPAFYHALYEYNRVAATPLYLMQGVYMDESDVAKYGDVFDSRSITIADMRQDIVNCVNMLHGNAVIGAKPGKASGVYRYDVSTYVIGWILGIECEAYFVEGTNKAHTELTSFQGRFVYTEKATPFEVFIAQMKELIIVYETDQYRMQRPVAFSNWVTTDPLKHPNEPREAEDSATIDVEHIKATPAFTPGFFASYHVYSYYPDFLNFPSGDPAVDADPYYAYVRSLVDYHAMPVLISEFGLPTSRGVTHINHLSGLNQGGNSEQQQAQGLVKMLDDIHRAGCMGGIVFAWHDEWFKTSWNTMDFDDSSARPKWLNVQSSEENFGLVRFSAFPSIQINGDDADWAGISVGGYTSHCIGEDMELVVKLHRGLRNAGKPYKIDFLPDPICWTQPPENLRDLYKQRKRWQIGLINVLMRHKDMAFNARYGKAGLLMLLYYWIFEFIGPIFETMGYFVIPLSWWLGIISWKFTLLFFLLVVMVGLILSLGAILQESYAMRKFPKMSQVLTLAAYALVDNFGFRQFNTVIRFIGCLKYRSGKSTWGSMKREKFESQK